MTFERFHNALRILLNIDADEFYRAAYPHGLRPTVHAASSDWELFRDNPHRWFIKAPDDKARAVWALVEARQPQAGKAA